MIRVAVGSTNPVKVGSVRRIFAELYSDLDLTGIDVPSGVPDQPVGDEETLLGAVNRARAALEAASADWGVGVEGGVAFREDGTCWMVQFCAVACRDGRTSIGKGAQILLPPAIARGVRAGGEVGPLVDAMIGTKDIKRQGGAAGFLTNGVVVREDLYAQMVATAMVRFLHPEMYDA